MNEEQEALFPAEPQRVELGGVSYIISNFDKRTVLQDHYMMRLMRLAELDKVMPMDNEDSKMWIARMQSAIIDSGRSHELLAGLMQRDDEKMPWSEYEARRNSIAIGNLNTQADREKVIDMTVHIAFGFFRVGLARMIGSLDALEERAEAMRVRHGNSMQAPLPLM